MWPILVLSIVTLGVVIERALFLVQEMRCQDHATVHHIFELVEHGKIEDAAQAGKGSKDRVARILIQGLEHRHSSLNDALLEASSQELERHNRGLVTLDTAVTLGPLLGLLGTVTGMIRAFGVIGGNAIADKQQAITGGVAEALIAVSFGLGVAILAIIPLNFFTARLEKVRRQLEGAMNRLTILLSKGD